MANGADEKRAISKAYPKGEPTGKKRLFCQYYVADTALNASAAVIKAGYAAKSAAQSATKFLADFECRSYIARLMEERAQRVQVDADYILRELTAIQQADLIEIINDDMTLKPLSEWPPTWRKCLSGFELVELFENSGDGKMLIGALKKIKWPDKLKTLELMGRHVGVGAFRDQLVVDDATSLADKLAAARQRVTKAKE